VLVEARRVSLPDERHARVAKIVKFGPDP